MDEWLKVPDDTLLSLQRRTTTGERSQWAVSRSADGVVVRRALFEDGVWCELEGRFADVQDVLSRVPELCEVRKGVINEYELYEDVMKPRDFVRLLDLGPQMGDENAADWPGALAEDWAWVSECVQRYGDILLLRWASVDGLWITGIESSTFIPLTVDEDDGPEAIRGIARCWWAFDRTNAPISWAGGYCLDLVAPGLAFSYPYNDEVESAEADAYRFVDLPEEPPKAFGEDIARWIIDQDSEVGAALVLEPFDPGNTFDADGQAKWDDAMYGIELGVEIYGGDDIVARVRESLGNTGGLYCATRDALANPKSEAGQRLLDAYREANIYAIRNGEWS